MSIKVLGFLLILQYLSIGPALASESSHSDNCDSSKKGRIKIIGIETKFLLAGRLEYCDGSEWRAVYDHNWHLQDAKKLCQAKDFPGHGAFDCTGSCLGQSPQQHGFRCSSHGCQASGSGGFIKFRGTPDNDCLPERNAGVICTRATTEASNCLQQAAPCFGSHSVNVIADICRPFCLSSEKSTPLTPPTAPSTSCNCPVSMPTTCIPTVMSTLAAPTSAQASSATSTTATPSPATPPTATPSSATPTTDTPSSSSRFQPENQSPIIPGPSEEDMGFGPGEGGSIETNGQSPNQGDNEQSTDVDRTRPEPTGDNAMSSNDPEVSEESGRTDTTASEMNPAEDGFQQDEEAIAESCIVLTAALGAVSVVLLFVLVGVVLGWVWSCYRHKGKASSNILDNPTYSSVAPSPIPPPHYSPLGPRDTASRGHAPPQEQGYERVGDREYMEISEEQRRGVSSNWERYEGVTPSTYSTLQHH